MLPTTVAQDPVGVQKTAEKKKLREMQVNTRHVTLAPAPNNNTAFVH